MNNSEVNDIEFVAITHYRNKDDACDLAMTIPAVKEFVDTWGGHCGANKKVFIGHVTHMLANIRAGYDATDILEGEESE